MEDFDYQVPEERTSQKFYGRAKWWIEHRERLRKLGIAFWIGIDALLILIALWVMFDAFILNYENERALTRELLVENQTTLNESSRVQAALPLDFVETAQVLRSGDGIYDFLSFVTNDNEEWWAEFIYEIAYGDTVLDPVTDFVYPGEQKPIAVLAIESSSVPSNAKLRVSDIRWHRINKHVLPDFDEWRNERRNFVVSDSNFTPAVEIGDQSIGRSTITIKNDSAFGYWMAPFTVLLRRGTQVVGVTQTTIDQFAGGDTKKVEINWFVPLPSVSEIEVVPTIQLFDSSMYLPLLGDTPLDTRIQIGQ